MSEPQVAGEDLMAALREMRAACLREDWATAIDLMRGHDNCLRAQARQLPASALRAVLAVQQQLLGEFTLWRDAAGQRLQDYQRATAVMRAYREDPLP